MTCGIVMAGGGCERGGNGRAGETAAPPEVPYDAIGYRSGASPRYLWEGEPFTGTATGHHENGQLALSYQMDDGQLHGTVREWYPDGTPKTETHFDHGQRHGSNTYWNPDGTILKNQLWENGQLVSDH